MDKVIKNRKALQIILQTILGCALIYFFSRQFIRLNWATFRDQFSFHPAYALLTVILILGNLGIDYQKWQLTVRQIVNRPEPKILIKSYLAGVTTGLLSPNSLGNFIGRMFWFPRHQRINITLLTFFSNGAQYLASWTYGLIGLCLFNFDLINQTVPKYTVISLLFAIYLIGLFCYYNLEKIPLAILQSKRWLQRFRAILLRDRRFKTHLLLLSILRYLVFCLQYFFALRTFGVDMLWSYLPALFVIYFITTLTPSLFFGKLVVRESVALWILTPLTNQGELILGASVFLWLVNQGIPASLGVLTFKKN